MATLTTMNCNMKEYCNMTELQFRNLNLNFFCLHIGVKTNPYLDMATSC